MDIALDERARPLFEAFKAARKKFTEDEAVPYLGNGPAGYLQALVQRGLLQITTKQRKQAFELTTTARTALKPAKKAAAPRSKKPLPATVEDLQAMEARIMARLESIGAGLQPATARTEDLAGAISSAIRDADRSGRFGGLVPIPEIRKVVLSRTRATRTQFDETLLALERDFRIDLKVANDARRPDAEDGIAVPGRGLVFFAIAK